MEEESIVVVSNYLDDDEDEGHGNHALEGKTQEVVYTGVDGLENAALATATNDEEALVNNEESTAATTAAPPTTTKRGSEKPTNTSRINRLTVRTDQESSSSSPRRMANRLDEQHQEQQQQLQPSSSSSSSISFCTDPLLTSSAMRQPPTRPHRDNNNDSDGENNGDNGNNNNNSGLLLRTKRILTNHPYGFLHRILRAAYLSILNQFTRLRAAATTTAAPVPRDVRSSCHNTRTVLWLLILATTSAASGMMLRRAWRAWNNRVYRLSVGSTSTTNSATNKAMLPNNNDNNNMNNDHNNSDSCNNPMTLLGLWIILQVPSAPPVIRTSYSTACSSRSSVWLEPLLWINAERNDNSWMEDNCIVQLLLLRGWRLLEQSVQRHQY